MNFRTKFRIFVFRFLDSQLNQSHLSVVNKKNIITLKILKILLNLKIFRTLKQFFNRKRKTKHVF